MRVEDTQWKLGKINLIVTGYKWLKRYEVEGVEGLQDRSRAAKHHPQAVPERLENAIVELRHQHRW